MENPNIKNFFKYVAIAGNILFVLWILYNGIDEGFRGAPMQIMVYPVLIALLILNSILMFSRT